MQHRDESAPSDAGPTWKDLLFYALGAGQAGRSNWDRLRSEVHDLRARLWDNPDDPELQRSYDEKVAELLEETA